MKNKSYKTINLVTLVMVLVFSCFVSVGYAAVNSTLTISGDLEYKPLDLYERVKADSMDSTKYAREYTDDKSTFTGNKNIYYYYGQASNNNVIFANYCWKIVRTTDTGGVKLIYNGEPNNGECGANRENHIGYKPKESISLNYYGIIYGTSYNFDKNLKVFTLEDTSSAIWSSTTYKDLIGKYTCGLTDCSTLYYIYGYKNGIEAYVLPIDNGNTVYSQIGESKFNEETTSPADVGYMYNKRYIHNSKYPTNSDSAVFGNSFSYNNTTKTYTLNGTKQTITDWSNSYNTLSNTHYTCWNTNGTCSTISYVYYTNSLYAQYINLENGKSIENALNEMLYDDNVNTIDSNIKITIDYWYSTNMAKYTSYLEDTVWCNDRSISSRGGWNPNGGSTSSYLFLNSSGKSKLTCPNKNDRFTVNSRNGNGALAYPVGLVTRAEQNLASLGNSGTKYWTLSPSHYESAYTYGYYVTSDGNYGQSFLSTKAGVRPAVSLRTGIKYNKGDGSSDNPYVIDMNS